MQVSPVGRLTCLTEDVLIRSPICSRARMNDTLVKAIKNLQFLSPFRRYFFYRYQYLFTPAQLAYLCSCLDRTRDVPGTIVEVGCAAGNTTVFLNKHLDSLESQKRYICIDTFEGFMTEDIRTEAERGKKMEEYTTAFAVNDKRWFDFTMASNNVTRVTSIKADAKTVDYTAYAPLSFCLVDVDLYEPVKAVLEKVHPLMSKGGIIVVDDCKANVAYDGALQAFQEFTSRRALPLDIRRLGAGGCDSSA